MVNAAHRFDVEVDMNHHAVFSSAHEADVGVGDIEGVTQNFNGSIHLVRVYDRALSDAEISPNFAVEPANKLTTTWGRVKQRVK